MRFDALLPRPRLLERLPGTVDFGPRLRIAGKALASLPAGRLERWLTARGWAVDPAARDELRLERVEDRELGEEGFRVLGDGGRLRIEAGGAAGLSHGLSLLAQLQEAPGAALRGAAFRVEDAPRHAWRGLQLDTARHRPAQEELLALLDDLAEHRLNAFHWHFCDDQGWSLPLPGALLPVPAEEAYSANEVDEVLARARELGLAVLPELDLPGHVRALLRARPELGCTGGPYGPARGWGVFEDVLCLGRPDLLAELEPWLAGLLARFDSPVIHLGGDEAPATRWAACPRCRARMAEHGLDRPEALQGRFAADLADWLGRRGRRLAAWDDLQERGAPPGTRLFAWRGQDAVQRAARAGFETVACPMDSCYFDRYPGAEPGQPRAIGGRLDWRKARAFDPLAGLARQDAARVIGGQACLWSEYVEDGATLRERLQPRLAALAEALWCGPAGTDDFPARLALHLPRLARQGRTPRLDPPLEVPVRWITAGGGLRLPLAAGLPGSRIEIRAVAAASQSGFPTATIADGARIENDAADRAWLLLPPPAPGSARAWRVFARLGELESRPVDVELAARPLTSGEAPEGLRPGLLARWFGCASPDWNRRRWIGPPFVVEAARFLHPLETGAEPCDGAAAAVAADGPSTPPLPPLADEGPRLGLRLEGRLVLAEPRVGHLGCEGGELARLWLGGELLLDHDGFRPAQAAFAPVALGAGAHRIVFEMLDLRRGALRFGWRAAGGELEDFRPGELRLL